MKKLLLVLVLGIALCAYTELTPRDKFDHLFAEAVTQANEDPSGTTYGITKSDSKAITLNTPVGEFDVEKKADGWYSFMGIEGKILSHKGSVYVIDTTLGKYEINEKKLTIKKL